MKCGVQTSLKDLLVVKDYLKYKPEQVKRTLKTFKLWAPLFRGDLPYKHRFERSRSYASRIISSNVKPGYH